MHDASLARLKRIKHACPLLPNAKQRADNFLRIHRYSTPTPEAQTLAVDVSLAKVVRT